MAYLLKSAGIITLFLLVYKIFLEKDTFFYSIRVFLMSGIVLAFIIPLISITTYKEVSTTNLSNFTLVNSQNNIPIDSAFDWHNLVFIIFIIGLCLTVGTLLFNLASLLRLLLESDVKRFNNFKIITTTKHISPFSFFNYIVYNPSQFNESELKQLIKHEQTHVLELHTIDMLLTQVLVCVQWFNPLAWMYKKAVNQNLEYIADQSAKHTITPENYSYLLLKTTRSNYEMAIANNFYNSLLKKRIMMLHKNHSHRFSQLKLALILPLLIAFIFSFNTKVVAQHKNDDTKAHKITISAFALELDKDASKDDLEEIKATFKNDFGLKIKIKNIKRNSKNEITGIRITASKGSSSTEYAVKGIKPIEPIRFMYNSKNNRIKIGAVTNKHFGNNYSYTHTNNNDFLKLDKAHKDGSDKNTAIYYVKTGDDIHKIKLGKKESFILISKGGKNHGTIIKSDNKDKIWKTKDGTLTEVIDIRTNKKGKNKKVTLKEIKIDNNDDIDASNNMFFLNTDNGTPPLFIVDGKEIENDALEKIIPESIKSISILKGEKAIKKYGEKAKNGVIEITIKNTEKN